MRVTREIFTRAAAIFFLQIQLGGWVSDKKISAGRFLEKRLLFLA